MSKQFLYLMVGLLATFFGATNAWAQIVTGNIVGTAYDETGAVIPGAEVVITNMQTQLSRRLITDELGNYAAAQLPPGIYTVTGTAPSFKKVEIEKVMLMVNQTVRIDLRFQVGEITEQVTVQSSPVVVEGETSSIGQVIEQQRILDLPLKGRNFMQLANISSGVAPAYNVRTAPITGQSGRSDLAVHISGGRGDTNSFLLDGVETRSSWFNSPSILVSVDAIQEFKIQKNLFAGDYGQGSGIVSLVTRSGSNEFHGSLYEFIRNDKLNAANFFDNFFGQLKPPLRYNQFGFSASGPLRKNRLFFFGNYEGLRERRSRTLTALVPTPEQLEGDLRGLPTTRRDPATGAPAIIDPATGRPFPDNRIPPERISRVARNFFPYIPKPTPGFGESGRNVVAARSRDRDDDQFTVRLDFKVSDSDSLFGRYTFFDSFLANPGLPVLSGSVHPYAGQNFVLQETHIFSPRMLNVVKFGYNRARVFNSWFRAGKNLAAEIGFKNLTLVPELYGLPTFNATQGFTLGGGATINQGGIDNLYQISDTMSLNRGRHNINLGVDLRALQFHELAINNANGTVTFDGRYTGSSVADFLLGHPASAQAFLGLSVFNWRSKSINLFITDDLKATSKLTLNLGLRYEYDSPPTEIDAKEGYFDTSRQQVILRISENQVPLRPPNIIFDPNLRPGIWFKDKNNFAPRVGAAYRLSDSTAIRTGYGIFYAKTQGNEIHFKSITVPLTIPVVLVGSLTTPNINIDRDLFPDPASPNFPLGSLLVTSIDPADRIPYIQQWNLSLQQKLPGQLLSEIAYVGSAGHKLVERTNINQAVPPADPARPTPIAQRRPFANFGDILASLFQENSNYNSLQAKLERRLSKGLGFLLTYTWSHSIDTASRGGGGTWHQDRRNLRGDRGNSDFDVRHRFVASYSYQLPFGPGQRFLSDAKGFVSKLVSGWEIHGITSFMTGNYFSVVVSGDRANVGTSFQRANLLPGCKGNLPRGDRSIDRYFNTSCFEVTQLGTFGNSGRNIIQIPGLNNWDLSLFKNTRVSEKVKLQFRVEFYNAWNHPQFGVPEMNVQSQFFGQIRGALEAREVQFGLKVLW